MQKPEVGVWGPLDGRRAAGLVLTLLLALVLAPGLVFGHDAEFPIEGGKIVIGSGANSGNEGFRFQVTKQAVVGPRHDPAVEGASLMVRGIGGHAGHTGTIELDPAFWQPIRSGERPTGYVYSDKNGTRGGITSFRVRDGAFTIQGRGEQWPWTPAGPQDAVEVIITIADEAFCARFGGSIVKNDAGEFRAAHAPAPEECTQSVCGNGELELDEVCDDGNLDDTDGCTRTCELGECELAAGIDSTFEAIQTVVFDSDVYGCSGGVCHGGGSTRGNLSLNDGESYDNLVGVPSFGSTSKRVEPGEPDLSYLYQLLAASTLGTPIPGGGTPMPTGGASALTERHLEGVSKWIRGGAPRDLVVEGTAELLGSCLPEPDPLTIPVPDPVFPGFGVQFQQTPWPLPAESESEICMATYYDVAGLVPDWAKVACPDSFVNVNNPSGECFAFHKHQLLQDPQSHHSIIHHYTGQFDTTDPGWGSFTRKFQDPGNPAEGTSCDPMEVDPNLGYNPGCSGFPIPGIACIGYGPPDYSLGLDFGGDPGGTAPAFSGSQEPFYELEFAPGTYSILPMSGIIVWNSHAFNLTSGNSTMSQYLNMFFAGRGDQLFPAQQIFDANSIFVQNVPPFESREYCRTYTIPVDSRLFQLSSHTHRHGKLWRIWEPPNTPCFPHESICRPKNATPMYYSTDYSDPVQLLLDPPVVHDDLDEASRTYLFCSVYDNGEELDGAGQQRYPVKRQSLSPEPPLVFGLPLGPGGPCPDAPGNPALGVACLGGPDRGQLCFGDDSLCAESVCDACPVLGGVTTEDEMFIQLGNFYVDDGSTSGTEITPDNVSALAIKWDFPLEGGVTSSPTVTENLVYASSWDGKVYALNKETGAEVWSFDTGTGPVAIGVQSTVTVAPGGQVLFGDSLANMYMLNGQTGEVIWQRSVGNPLVDHIWSSATVANGRVFIGVASHSDTPCTNGRLVALDLPSGDELWTHQNVPDGVCDTDTSIECTGDAQCGGGSCVPAVGAGVTATVSLDPSGESVYVATVGCYTFPSVGDSDSIMKLDAATGASHWVTRVNPPEQFGSCDNDPSIDCGSEAACGGGACTVKAFYHDFGFLNGPIPVDVDDGSGGKKTILVAGSKNGTLYALNEPDGTIAWSNAVRPIPVSPAFAGFGLFNGALGYEDGRFFASLYQFIPASDPEPEHLMAFDVNDGHTLWSGEIGPSWGHVTASNGVVFSGTTAASEFYAYDAVTGQRLAAFPLPATTSSQASVEETSLYIGYGIFGDTGGVRAYILP